MGSVLHRRTRLVPSAYVPFNPQPAFLQLCQVRLHVIHRHRRQHPLPGCKNSLPIQTEDFQAAVGHRKMKASDDSVEWDVEHTVVSLQQHRNGLMAASHDEDGAASIHMDDQRLFVDPPENELTRDRSGRCDAQRLHVSREWGGRLLQGVLADVEQGPVLIGNSASTAKSGDMTRNMGFSYPNAWFPATRRGRG